MLTTDYDHIPLPLSRRVRAPGRLWREWCFLRAVGSRFWVRALLFVALLLGGGLLFQHYEPQRNTSLLRGIHCVWSLIFANPPEDFPIAPVLQVLFFLVLLLGLTVIVESIVELALLIRDRRRNERNWCKIMATTLKNHIILVGLGKLGYRTYRLLRELGLPLVVLERNAGNQFLEDLRRDGTPLFIGDARREALLVDANTTAARSIIIATNDDLANLEIALDARQINPTIRVVLRMFDQNMADKVRVGFNLPTTMSQSAISAPAFALAALEEDIVSTLAIDDQLVVLRRFQVDAAAPIAGLTVGQVMTRWNVGVLERRPPEDPAQLLPPPETELHAGDQLLVQGTYDALAALAKDLPVPATAP